MTTEIQLPLPPPKKMAKWWGYMHIHGSTQVAPYYGNKQELVPEHYMRIVKGPFQAPSYEEAQIIFNQLLKLDQEFQQELQKEAEELYRFEKEAEEREYHAELRLRGAKYNPSELWQ